MLIGFEDSGDGTPVLLIPPLYEENLLPAMRAGAKDYRCHADELQAARTYKRA